MNCCVCGSEKITGRVMGTKSHFYYCLVHRFDARNLHLKGVVNEEDVLNE